MTALSRRTFLLGAATALAAPAVVRAESLMKLWVPEPISWHPPSKHLLDMLSAIEAMKPEVRYYRQPLMLAVTHVEPLLVSWSAAQDHTNWSAT